MRNRSFVPFVALFVLTLLVPLATPVVEAGDATGLDGQAHVLEFANSIPNQLSYQGYLADAADSSAVTATLEMTFRLFDSETKGAELWSETHSAVEVNSGLFQVLLGSITPFSGGLFDGSELWLQTEVGTEILSPRKPLVSVAYSQMADEADHATTADQADNALEAQHAVHADTVTYCPSSNPWTVSGDDIYRETGNVGIGTTTPSHPLDVAGAVSATTYYGDGGNLTGISGTTDNDWTIDGNHVYRTMGTVGIGTADADTSYRLHVVQDCDGPNHAAIYAHAYRSTSPTFGPMYGIFGSVDAADMGGAGVCGYATSLDGYAEIFGVTGATDVSDGYGVYGQNALSGNFGYLGGGLEVAKGSINHGVYGQSITGYGVYGKNTTSGHYAYLGGPDWAGFFEGDVSVSGGISADSGYQIDGSTVLSTEGIENILLGVGAGESNSGDKCTFVGYHTGAQNQSHFNTFIGASAGDTNSTGLSNTFVGALAGRKNIGGSKNAFFGTGSGWENIIGDENTFIGAYAGQSNTYGHNNTYLGHSAGQYNTTGSGNVFIGYYAGEDETGSNKLYIANSGDTSDVLIYGNFSTGYIGLGTLNPNTKLDIQGEPDALALIKIDQTGNRHYAGLRLDREDTEKWFVGMSAFNDNLTFRRTASSNDVVIDTTGNVGIGMQTPSYKLDVAGDINTTGEIRKNGSAYNHPDYVFEPEYELISLAELEDYLAQNKHLPGMPSAQEVREEGVKLFEQNRLLLEKLEESYLYIAELQNRVAKLETALENYPAEQQ
jgi:hypothetical protein